MSPTLRESLLKGLFLAVWAYLGLILPPSTPNWSGFGTVVGGAVGGLAVGLIVGTIVQLRRGLKPTANPAAFPLVVLLESSFWISAGLILGLVVGVIAVMPRGPEVPGAGWLGPFAVGGLLLGYGFQQLRQIRSWGWRFGIAAGLGIGLVTLALHYLELSEILPTTLARRNFAIVLLVGLPFFYLLTFCGEADESEVEIAALAAALAVGLYLFGLESGLDVMAGKLILIVPLLLYFVYVTRVQPGLRVFKHTLRGFTALHVGRHVESLGWFRRALRLDAQSPLARRGMMALHEDVDVARLPPDSDLLAHLDYGFCLDQASEYLIGGTPPTPADRAKADRMLGLVESRSPKLAARVDYLRAVSLTHAKQFDAAAEVLSKLLSPETPYDDRIRRRVLLPAWELGLRLHPELVKRLGPTELAKPGRRMQLLAAVERRLAEEPADATANELKTSVYPTLQEAEFVADAASGVPTEFNYEFVEQLGLALVADADADRRTRGMAFLRIAARGLPDRAPVLFRTLADTAAADGRSDEVRGYLEQVKRCGVDVGYKNLSAEQRAVYLKTLQELSAAAEARGDFENAIGDMRLYMECGRNEVSSYRKLADLYEQQGDALNALLMTETALLYNATDADLLARKDRYYYSVTPERLAAVRDRVTKFFDVGYCGKKAKQVLDQRDTDADALNWALHLSRLAKVIQPDAVVPRVNEARCLLRLGERTAAVAALEDVREMKPSGSAEEDAWYLATKLIGDMYLDELARPDLAVGCFQDYRKYSKSGADTLFNLARAYEGTGDTANALRLYDAVTTYEQHPKYWDAKEAVRRLGGH